MVTGACLGKLRRDVITGRTATRAGLVLTNSACWEKFLELFFRAEKVKRHDAVSSHESAYGI